MAKHQSDAQAIVDILEDAIAEWKLSHEQLARLLGCSKESVENWLQKKCRPRPAAIRAIERLREHFEDGKPFPPRLELTGRNAHTSTSSAEIQRGVSDDSVFANEATAAARRFFESIACKQFDTAWKCLTRTFQDRRWPDGMGQFVAGYESFIGLSNLIVAPLNPVIPPACRVFVYYEDLSTVIELPGLGKWSAARLGQIEDCCKDMVRVRNAIVKTGGARQSVEQVAVSGLFTEQAGNILHDASRLPRGSFFSAIGTETAQQCLLSVPLIAKVLRVNKGRFLIDRLLPVQWGKRASDRA